jgi:hypothetical protein
MCSLRILVGGVLELFRKTRSRRARSAQATGTQAEFKWDLYGRKRHAPHPEIAGLLT